MERILKVRITVELWEKNWLTDVQHGFRARRSTATNLMEFYETVTEKFDNNEPVDILYFDLARAFDTVPHTRVLYKLKEIQCMFRLKVGQLE